ncbi:hypothetical protein MVEN_00078100 [Mycena venus]|uniref:Uncharacterized protein n=1 Tax=Mycena venus TaxID=2733690 RepID=A0A8H7DE68_9AGAR|nr:hypothetical protein MVEN_00078100 [Mycena venus]
MTKKGLNTSEPPARTTFLTLPRAEDLGVYSREEGLSFSRILPVFPIVQQHPNDTVLNHRTKAHIPFVQVPQLQVCNTPRQTGRIGPAQQTRLAALPVLSPWKTG